MGEHVGIEAQLVWELLFSGEEGLLREQAAFNACLNTRAALYAMLYPEDELTLKELCAGLVRNKAMEMCK